MCVDSLDVFETAQWLHARFDGCRDLVGRCACAGVKFGGFHVVGRVWRGSVTKQVV